MSDEELFDALMSLLARPAPTVLPIPLDTMDIDWEALRLMVRAKMFRDRIGATALSRIIGVADTALGRFIHSPDKRVEVRTLIRLMMWLGYSDFEPFLKEE